MRTLLHSVPVGFLSRSARRAFTRTDLIAILGVAVLFSLLLTPVLATLSRDSELTICFDNLRQTMRAVAMYSSDNGDYLPHPSWGGDLSGPDNWAYATRLSTGERAQSAAGRAGPDAFKPQLPFFSAGRLAPFLNNNQRPLVCPMDWRESMTTKSASYRYRPQKLTSYSMNGVVGGYIGPYAEYRLAGRTYKTSDFLPADLLLWEQADADAFYFNDAGNNPETIGEGISTRHGAPSAQGFGCAGTASGSAAIIRTEHFESLQKQRGPNDLKCGPPYRR